MAARLEMGARCGADRGTGGAGSAPSSARADPRSVDVGLVPGRPSGGRAARLPSQRGRCSVTSSASSRAASSSVSRRRSLLRTLTLTRPSGQVRTTTLDATGAVGNLPAAVSSFIGRTRELSEISSLVESRRLITLVGPGGAGKTRLALEVAERRALRIRRRGVVRRIRAAEIWQRRRSCGRHSTRCRRQRPPENVRDTATDAAAVRQLRARARRRRGHRHHLARCRRPASRSSQPAASVSAHRGNCCTPCTPSKQNEAAELFVERATRWRTAVGRVGATRRDRCRSATGSTTCRSRSSSLRPAPEACRSTRSSTASTTGLRC